MSLKPAIDSLEGLHEEVAKLYIKRDGKFVLDVEDSGLKSALEKERDRAEVAEKALKAREKTEEEARKKAEEAQALAKGDYEKLKANLEAEKAAILKDRDEAQTGLKAYLLRSEITAAIAAQKGNPLLQKLVADQFEAVISPDGEHKVLVKSDPTKTPAQFIEGLKKDPAYGAFFEGFGASGGGGNPGGTGKQASAKPWKEMSLDEQTSLWKSNPTQAKALQEGA